MSHDRHEPEYEHEHKTNFGWFYWGIRLNIGPYSSQILRTMNIHQRQYLLFNQFNKPNSVEHDLQLKSQNWISKGIESLPQF